MARPLRIEYPGAWHHVINRGATRQRTFINPTDYQRFLALLGDIYEMWNVETHAFCLMGNHYHLLLHTPSGNLSRAMRHVDGVYTQRFNKAHDRDGSLFRGRFKSTLIEKDEYLLELVRYIHLNPVKAGITAKASIYRWSSHRHYLNPDHELKWLVTDETLSIFGKRRYSAIKEYKKFVRAGVPKKLERRLAAKKLPTLLGSEGFRDWVKYNFVEKLKAHQEIPDARRVVRKKVPAPTIMRIVASLYAMSAPQLKVITQGRAHEARDATIYLLRKIGGMGYAAIGTELGGLRTSTIAQAIQRFTIRLEKNDTLQVKVDALAEHILSLVKT